MPEPQNKYSKQIFAGFLFFSIYATLTFIAINENLAGFSAFKLLLFTTPFFLAWFYHIFNKTNFPVGMRRTLKITFYIILTLNVLSFIAWVFLLYLCATGNCPE